MGSQINNMRLNKNDLITITDSSGNQAVFKVLWLSRIQNRVLISWESENIPQNKKTTEES